MTLTLEGETREPENPFRVGGLITRSADHRYTYEGKTYPGVTTVLKVLDKSGPLMGWAAKETAKAAIGMLGKRSGETPGEPDHWNADPLIQMLASVGEEGVIKALTSRSNWTRDDAARTGTALHDIADTIAREGLAAVGDIDPKLEARAQLYAEWWAASGWKLRSSEAMIVHPQFGYGGTLDLLAYDRDGATVLADIKTGKGVYQEAVLQLAAYGDAPLIEPPGASAVYSMPAIDRHVILHVTATGVREIEVSVGTMERVAWAACLDLYAWAETMKGKRL